MPNLKNLGNEKIKAIGTGDGANLIGCCGIYCGACPFYRSEIPALAKELKNALNEEKFNKIAVPFEWVGDYKEFKRWLNFLAKTKCDGCQAGGGNPFCSIRKCCWRKEIISCAECDDFPCRKKFLKWISERYRNWNVRNIERIREIGYEKWLEEKEREVSDGFVTGLVIRGIKRERHGERGKGKVNPEQA